MKPAPAGHRSRAPAHGYWDRRIGGFEEWTIGEDGLIASSLGHYDQAEYDRQLQQGVDEPQ